MTGYKRRLCACLGCCRASPKEAVRRLGPLTPLQSPGESQSDSPPPEDESECWASVSLHLQGVTRVPFSLPLYCRLPCTYPCFEQYIMMPATPECWLASQENSKKHDKYWGCRLCFTAPQILVLTMTSAGHGVYVRSKEWSKTPQRPSSCAKSRQAHKVPCMTTTIAWQPVSPHSKCAAYAEWQITQEGMKSRAFIQQRTGAEHGSVRAPVKEHWRKAFWLVLL